jgi:hypothetical protein
MKKMSFVVWYREQPKRSVVIERRMLKKSLVYVGGVT